jgi:hypothetical protein
MRRYYTNPFCKCHQNGTQNGTLVITNHPFANGTIVLAKC